MRVRAGRARVALLQRELEKMSGSSTPTDPDEKQDSTAIYPSLRQLPLLSVRWADLYRRVRVQETVFDLLSQEYEMARIQEVKELPVISVIDPPSWPERKSFPPRLLIMLVLTVLAVVTTSVGLLARRKWYALSPEDPRRALARKVQLTLKKAKSCDVERARQQGEYESSCQFIDSLAAARCAIGIAGDDDAKRVGEWCVGCR